MKTTTITKANTPKTSKAQKAELKRQEIEDDKQRAIDLSEALADLIDDYETAEKEYAESVLSINEEHAKKIKPFKDTFDNEVAPISESIESAKKELLEIGKRQRKTLFNIKNRFEFPNGFYIHAKQKTEVKLLDGFDLSKFAKKFSKYFDVSWKVAPLIKLFTDGDERKKSKIDKYFIDLTTEETLEVKRKAQDIEKG